MKQLTNRLVNILNVELKAYDKLLEILHEEQDALVNWYVGELQAIVERKDRQLEQVTRLEKKRMDFLSSIQEDLNSLGLPAGNGEDSIKLSDIITMMGKPEGENLRNLQKSLAVVVKDVTTTNYKNQVLLKRSLEIVNANLNIYAQSDKLANTYNAAGDVNSNVEKHLIDGAI
ncbi:MAG: flagellar protein FlgN [Candidatus Marinimicrobia bacterium]|nr:flagellar protein FlgN [Candidatus Neomarinimicrobiota bacterium]MCF7880536.1 flagellar protein FlgN [Candidatus Neomarinimicrobiota bacterium]